MDRRQLPLWLFTLTVGGAATLPRLCAEGTFLDGEIYACLARNAAAGRGTFWAPHFSATTYTQWFEHPPLGIFLGSLPFRVLGDHILVEHLYAFAILLLAGWMLVAAWRRLFADQPGTRALGWLPLLMWLLNPQVTWAYANNMLECAMSLFTMAAVWLTVTGLIGPRVAWGRVLLGAPLLILAAVLTKDVVGFFPLATALALALAGGAVSWRRAWLVVIAQTAVVAALLALLLAWPAARENLVQFTQTQLLASLSGRRGETANQFVFLVKLFNTLLPSLLLAAFLWLAGRRHVNGKAPGPDRYARWSWALLALGLAGSVPLVVSERQSLFYVVPSFPFYALGLAVLVGPRTAAAMAAWRTDSRRWQALTVATVVLLVAVAGWSISRFGTVYRSPAARADARLIVAHLHAADGGAAEEPVVEIPPNLAEDWGLETLLQRYGAVAVSRTAAAGRWYVASADPDTSGLVSWQRVPLATTTYHLYRSRPR